MRLNNRKKKSSVDINATITKAGILTSTLGFPAASVPPPPLRRSDSPRMLTTIAVPTIRSPLTGGGSDADRRIS